MKRYFPSVLGPEFEHRFRVLILKLYFTTIMYPFKFCLWYYNQSKDFQLLAMLKICLNELKQLIIQKNLPWNKTVRYYRYKTCCVENRYLIISSFIWVIGLVQYGTGYAVLLFYRFGWFPGIAITVFVLAQMARMFIALIRVEFIVINLERYHCKESL